MNFFENCRLSFAQGRYIVNVLGYIVELSDEQNAELKKTGVGDRFVTVGVRPVHMNIGSDGIAAEVDVSELMGSEMHLHLNAGGKDIVAVVPTANLSFDAFARHARVKLMFDARLIHIFDPETERNLI